MVGHPGPGEVCLWANEFDYDLIVDFNTRDFVLLQIDLDGPADAPPVQLVHKVIHRIDGYEESDAISIDVGTSDLRYLVPIGTYNIRVPDGYHLEGVGAPSNNGVVSIDANHRVSWTVVADQ